MENTEKYITFLILMQKQNKNGKIVSYKIKFIDSIRFMASLLSRLADNFAKGLWKGKWENYKYNLGYAAFKNNTLTFKYLECNKNFE